MNRKALIFGITGQDGSYLSELLLSKNYEVHGTIRRASTFNTERIDHIFNDIKLYYCDLSDGLNIFDIINDIRPHEIYHLGAQSHVLVSFKSPVYTTNINCLGTIQILEAIRKVDPYIRFYNAASSEMFGKVLEVPQTETTPFNPVSPYGCSKVYSYYVTKNYREAYNIHASNGILFNHESPRRGGTFVTQKIVKGIANIVKGKQEYLELGNLQAKRDWGHARDYVKAMWLMLQQDKPDDYVIAIGENHTVNEFLNVVLTLARLTDKREKIIKINPKYYRPNEVDELLGNATKARTILGWKPEVDFISLAEEMWSMALNGQTY